MRSIAFTFHRKRTILKLPIAMWFGMPLSVGDIDVSPHAAHDGPSVIVAKLEALRGSALGHEDGVIPGAAELPTARVVDRAQIVAPSCNRAAVNSPRASESRGMK
jgi:hypothetical protein